MRHIKILGTKSYEGERSTTLVMLYLLSVRLKSTATCPIELSEILGISSRTAQRFIYNSFGSTHKLQTINLELLTSILQFVNLSLVDLFSAVELFRNSKYDSATYNLKTNSYSFWSKGELEENDTAHLEELLRYRRAIVNKLSFKVSKLVRVEVDNLISQFPLGVFNRIKLI